MGEVERRAGRIFLARGAVFDLRHSHKSNSRCSSWRSSRWRASPSPQSGEGGRRPDEVRKAGMVRRRFAVTAAQSDLGRSGGPHPIRPPGLFDQGVAPPPGLRPGAGSSPASWGRGPRRRDKRLRRQTPARQVFARPSISAFSVATVEASASPSTRSGRKWRWNAATTARVRRS